VAGSRHLDRAIGELHTLFCPSSCECCKEAHEQCEQRVRSHGWEIPFGAWKVGE
jgi:hypothetical protein